MSPSSRSKAKDKSSGRALMKEQQKNYSKSTSQATNGGAINSVSTCHPASGILHTLETARAVSSSPPCSNGRFKGLSENGELSAGGLFGRGPEYESVSNNDACSVESEDQKDKTPSTNHRFENIPGADNDKRDKIRQKNGRKHQRQRERRAQELHERCSGYLMSRKLEALSQKLVGMGFSSERATMALILNEGRVEESVAWLFEGGEDVDEAQQECLNLSSGCNLKIEIVEELAWITHMESHFKCTKQEVERVVVACEGDLDKAEKMLTAQKQEWGAVAPKLEETVDTRAINNKNSNSCSQDHRKTLQGRVTSAAPLGTQQRRDERDLNYTAIAGGSGVSQPDATNSRKIQSKVRADWVRPPQQPLMLLEKRWLKSNTSSLSSSSSTAQVTCTSIPTKAEVTKLPDLGEDKSIHVAGLTTEPVLVMQRPQSRHVYKQRQYSTSLGDSSQPSRSWYRNGINGVDNVRAGDGLSHMKSTTASDPQLIDYLHHNYQQQYQIFSSIPSDSTWESPNTTALGSLSSTAIEVPSSLGLFTGQVSGPGMVDWSTSDFMPECDYTNIDWSLEATSGFRSGPKNGRVPAMFGGANLLRSSGAKMLHGGTGVGDEGIPPPTGSQEWTSPFAGKDLFSIPRKSVNSPSPQG